MDKKNSLSCLQNNCRICLRPSKNLINLNDEELLDKIAAISSIQIKFVNELSDHVCDECFKLIDTSYKFRLVIIDSHNDLNSRLKTLKATNYLTKQKSINYSITSTSSSHSSNTTTTITSTTANSTTTGTVTTRSTVSSRTKPPAKKPRRPCDPRDKSKPVQCELCNKMCSCLRALWSHRNYVHRRKYVLCNICGVELIASNLPKHITAKHTKIPVCCDECGKICQHAEALRTHKKYNHRAKIFTCHICGKAYTLRCRLKRHLRYHNKEVPRRKIPCEVCGKEVASIQRHMLSHTGERPYVCTYCNKGLTSSCALKVHVRLHTNEKPFACHLCDAAYPQPVSLRTHLKSKHGIIEKKQSNM